MSACSQRQRILVIDDEDDIREVAQVTLEILGGWEVFTAERAADALAAAVAHRPDVILLDVMMPDVDGLAMLRQLQAHPDTRNIPVVLLTANAQRADLATLRRLGAAAVLTKPFDPSALCDDVNAVLVQSRSMRNDDTS